MTENALRGVARAFADAFASRDPDRIAAYLDDTVDWMIFGPIDLFPFFGRRRGRAAVLAMFGQAAGRLQFGELHSDILLASGDRAAGLARITFLDRDSGRTLSLRFSYFLQMSEGRIVCCRCLLDSFDAAEQVLGREISLSAA